MRGACAGLTSRPVQTPPCAASVVARWLKKPGLLRAHCLPLARSLSPFSCRNISIQRWPAAWNPVLCWYGRLPPWPAVLCVVPTAFCCLVRCARVQDAQAKADNTASYRSWVNPDDPDATAVYFKVYLFHITNSVQVMAGANPIVVEKGPYVYRYVHVRDQRPAPALRSLFGLIHLSAVLCLHTARKSSNTMWSSVRTCMSRTS
jgi:hypothetical protein